MLQVTRTPQTLRGYQLEAVEAVLGGWNGGKLSVMAALATGAGKTTILAEILKQVCDPNHQRSLVIAHTQEIIYQLYERIAHQYGGQLDNLFTMNLLSGLGIVMGENDNPDARIVIATRQSLHTKRLKRLMQTGAFDNLFIDEAHHALGDNTYGAIVEELKAANPNLKILGLTATPKRTDKKALKTIFDDIVYQWLIPDGIKSGNLVPVTQIRVKTQVDLTTVKSSKGDYDQKKMVSLLEVANWLELCVKAYKEHILATNRPTLAFMPSVQMSKDFAAALRAEGVAAEHLDGTTPNDIRLAILKRYSEGTTQVISNMAVLTEGFDAPRTGAIFMARPTRSESLYTQILGRGLRPFPNKADCLLVNITAVDTKAVKVGDLVGRMIQCPECESDYFAGFRHCPVCGHEKPEEKKPAQKPNGQAGEYETGYKVGQDINAEYSALFDQTFSAWYTDNTFFTCPLGFDEGTLVIAPMLNEGVYRLFLAPKDYTKPCIQINENDDLNLLMQEADDYLKAKGTSKLTNKNEPWRNQPATYQQLEQLKKKKILFDPNNITKGDASKLLGHAFAVRQIKDALKS